MNPEVFREYDIRGVVERDFDDRFVADLGRAYAALMGRAGRGEISLGRDCRLSSERLHGLLLDGLLDSGINVIDLGVVPTPLLYFSVAQWGLDGGVMITGSHNPPEYNGFKLVLGGLTIYGEQIQELRRIIERRDFPRPSPRGKLAARTIVPEYQEFIRSQFKFNAGLKVVVDGGNGCGGVVAAPLMRELGIETIELFIEMDGRFPNHHPDPTVETNMRDLIRAVISNRAQLGIAYDGDADRIGAVDENGRLVWGDELITLFARDIVKRAPGAAIIADVKCSQRVYDDIARRGGRPIMWKTGHSLLKSKLKEERALFAGEMSGHMFFADRYYGFDDAIYASFRLLEIINAEGQGLGAMLSDLPAASATPEIRVECPDNRKFEIVRAIAAHFRAHHEVIEVDGARVKFADGWGLVRASNTQPALVMRFEASTEPALAAIRYEFEDQLRKFGLV
jgi:phosphomannomutase/phosphoglucomutase